MGTYAKLFGRAALRQGESWLEPPAGKTSALLYYLAYRGDWVRRDELTFLFWSDTTEEKARGNLRRILTTIRSLAYASTLESDPKRVRWAIDTDVQAFRQALSEQRPATAAGLYEGVLLDGLALPNSPEFDSWLECERQAWHERWRLSMLEWATELESAHRFRDASEILGQLHHADALDEEALRRYLRALHASGRKNKALDVFRAFAETLRTELGSEPEQATVQIADSIQRDLPAGFTSPKTHVIAVDPRERPTHNLPPQPTAFIGRDLDKAKVIAALVEPTTRLLTIVGPGGMGKTRLAVEVARTQVGMFEHGVCFVGFASVGSPELMTYAVADALGFSFFGTRSPEDQLRDHLGKKELLLVLDNLEHLLAGAQWISEVLESSTGVKILATSRERLNLRAERTFDLAGLPVPHEGEQEAEGYDAVKLFVQSAATASFGFALDSSNMSAIVRICYLVQGLPLAIEMAASWLRVLDANAVAAEIERGIDILQSSARDVPARHRSMQAVFDQSWDLLSGEERDALVKLSVCEGGFTREAAAEIASADLPLLSSLFDKSFLSFARSGRYSSHPLVLQYTRQQLAKQPDELRSARERHGRYYLRLVRDRENAMRTRQRRETLEALSAELPNIRSAWTWAIENERVEEIAASSFALGNLFESSVPEGAAFFAQAVAALDETNPAHRAALGYALIQQAEFLRWLPQGGARPAVERALTLLSPETEPRGVMRALVVHAGNIWTCAESTSDVFEMLEHGLELARKHGIRREIGEFLCLMVLLENSTVSPRVEQVFKPSLAEVERMGDLVHVAFIKQQFGAHLVLDGSPKEGLALLQESLDLVRDLDFQRFEPFLLDDLAMAAYRFGDYERAEAFALEHLASAAKLGMEISTRDAWWILGRAATIRGDFSTAHAHLTRGLRHSRLRHSTMHTLVKLLPFIHLALARGNVARAAELLGVVRSRLTQVDESHVFSRLLPFVGDELDELLDALRNLMNGDEVDDMLERGGATSLEDAVSAILAE